MFPHPVDSVVLFAGLYKKPILPLSAKHVYVSPHIYWGILLWKAQVGCRESWVMLWDSSSSKRLSARREGSNFNLETEGLMKQLSAWLQLNYSSTQEVSQLKSLTRYSSPPSSPMLFHSHTKTIHPHTHTNTHTKATHPTLILNYAVPSRNAGRLWWRWLKSTQ